MVAAFFRAAAVCFVVTGLTAVWKWHVYPINVSPKLIVAALGLATMALWLVWQRREFVHWFPLHAAPGARQTPNLAPPGNWQTPFWFFVYWFIWAQIFAQGQLAGL